MFKALSKLNIRKSAALRIGALVLAVFILLCCRPYIKHPVFAAVLGPVGQGVASGLLSEAILRYGPDGLDAIRNTDVSGSTTSGGGVSDLLRQHSGRSFIGDAVSRVTLGELVKKGADGVGDLLTWFNDALQNGQDIAEPSTFQNVYNNYITEYNYNYAGTGTITCPLKFNVPYILSKYSDRIVDINETTVTFFGYVSFDELHSINYVFNYPGYLTANLHYIFYYSYDGTNYNSLERWCGLNGYYISSPYLYTSGLCSAFDNYFTPNGFYSDRNLSGYYYICSDSYVQYVPVNGVLNIDNSTRITDITNNWGDTITNIDNATGDTSYITTNESGDTYYIFPIFDEGDGSGTDGTFIDPQGYTHNTNNWTYDYSDRSYHFTEEYDNSDHSVTTHNDYSVTYGDEYVTIDKRVTTTDNSTNTTTNNYVTNNYYYAEYDPSKDPDYPTTPFVPDGGGGSGGGSLNPGITIPDFDFDGSWLSDAIGMVFTLLTALMDHNNDLLVTSGGYNANLNVTGTVDLNVNLPAPSGGGSGSGSGDDGGSGSGSLQLLDVNQLVEVVMTPFNLIGSFLEGVVNGITAFIQNTLSLMTDMTDLLGGFGVFISSFFLWMPPEIRVVIISGFSILFGLSVIKLFRGG